MSAILHAALLQLMTEQMGGAQYLIQRQKMALRSLCDDRVWTNW